MFISALLIWKKKKNKTENNLTTQPQGNINNKEYCETIKYYS